MDFEVVQMKDVDLFMLEVAVDVTRNPVEFEDFMSKLTEWIESNQWTLAGEDAPVGTERKTDKPLGAAFRQGKNENTER